MKKILLFFISLILLSCNDYYKNITQKKTPIEGKWYKEGNLHGTRVIFKGNTFEIASEKATIKGVFKLINNQFIGTFKTIYGDVNAVLTPYEFKGEATLESEKIKFSNFSGSWTTVFKSSYSKK